MANRDVPVGPRPQHVLGEVEPRAGEPLRTRHRPRAEHPLVRHRRDHVEALPDRRPEPLEVVHRPLPQALVVRQVEPARPLEPARVVGDRRLLDPLGARTPENGRHGHRPSVPCPRQPCGGYLRYGHARLHLPELQEPLGRHRRLRGVLRLRRAAVPALRIRLHLPAARGLLPGSLDGLHRLRPRRAGARGRARRVRADGLPGGRPDGARRRRRPRALGCEADRRRAGVGRAPARPRARALDAGGDSQAGHRRPLPRLRRGRRAARGADAADAATATRRRG